MDGTLSLSCQSQGWGWGKPPKRQVIAWGENNSSQECVCTSGIEYVWIRVEESHPKGEAPQPHMEQEMES